MKPTSSSPLLHRMCQRRSASRSAFTLLEVLLAVGLVAGLLVVALFYHQQAELFRSGLLDELNRVTVVRQLMNRLTVELNTLAPEAGALRGSAAELRFAFAAVGVEDAATGRAHAGLRQVSYQLPLADDPEAPTPSLRRTERPLETAPAAASDEPPSAGPPADAGDGITFGDLLTDASGGGESESPSSTPGAQTLDEIHFFNLRYFDGTNWVESWEATLPPLGIEVSLGFDPPETDVLPEDYAGEVFRRIIALPVSGPAPVANGGGAAEEGSAEPSDGGISPSAPADEGRSDSGAGGFGGALLPPDDGGGSGARGGRPRDRRRGGRGQ